jgi:VIT1/CCC1 family predicted Fe2+/Mn2+ transporter
LFAQCGTFLNVIKAREFHRGDRIGWLRAAVLGANDGVLSTASIIAGVAAAHVAPRNILIAGIAGLVAGAMSRSWLLFMSGGA